MKTLLAPFLLLLGILTSPAHSDPSGSIAGDTIKEREIRWFWKYLGEIVRDCAKNGEECQDPAIQATVQKLATSLPDTLSDGSLQFVAESSGLFQTAPNDGHRLAVTDLKPGSTVYINTDRMDLPATQWVGILVHECVHHLSIVDDALRLPDQVGTALATYATRALSRSTLEEFGHPDQGVLILSSPSLDRPAHVLIFLEQFSSDQDLSPNARVPICDPGETFLGQKVGPMFWRASYVRGSQGYVYLRGSAQVHNSCQSGTGAVREVQTAFIFNFQLNFWERFDPRSAWWNAKSAVNLRDLSSGNYDGLDLRLDIGRTFAVESIRYPSSSGVAGSIWSTRAIVVSTEGMVPNECLGYFYGTRWFYNRQNSLTLGEPYDECKITPLGEHRYQIDLAKVIPVGAQPDLFTLQFIAFIGGTNLPHFAIPPKPQFFEVLNPSAPPPLKTTDWVAEGVERIKTIYGAKTNNSFRVQTGQPFWIELRVIGQQPILDHFVDLDMLVAVNGDAVTAPWNPSLQALKEKGFLIGIEDKTTASGRKIRYHFVLLSNYSGMPLIGFKLRRIHMKTSDFSWTETQFEDFPHVVFATNAVPD